MHDLPPHGLDIHQVVQELEPLLVRLVLTQERVLEAFEAGFAPISVAVKPVVVEGGQGRNCLLCVGGKGVLHVCGGLGVSADRSVPLSATDTASDGT